MIQKFVDRFMQRKDIIEKEFALHMPDEYLDVVKIVIDNIGKDDFGGIDIDFNTIHEVQYGGYTGMCVYVMEDFEDVYAVKINYGSCSHCDTLQRILMIDDHAQRIKDYMTLALHIIQRLVKF